MGVIINHDAGRLIRARMTDRGKAMSKLSLVCLTTPNTRQAVLKNTGTAVKPTANFNEVAALLSGIGSIEEDGF